MKKLLLIGIKHTMQSPFYRDVFMKHGMEVITPSEEEQDEINDIIFKELVLGIYKNTTRNKLLDIINNYDEDGIILGCTELSLAINQEDTKIKLLNKFNRWRLLNNHWKKKNLNSSMIGCPAKSSMIFSTEDASIPLAREYWLLHSFMSERWHPMYG